MLFMDSTKQIEKMVELDVRLQHLQGSYKHDYDALFDKQRELEANQETLEKKIEKTNAEISRYKWILFGIGVTITFIWGLLQSVASATSVTLSDLFRK